MQLNYENVITEYSEILERRKLLNFKSRSQEILNSAQDLPESAKEAASEMIKHLEELLNNVEKLPLLQNQLKKDAQRIIAHYATDLEVYPGFWNRLKNFIKCAVKPRRLARGYKVLEQNKLLLYTLNIYQDEPWGSRR
jgi:hypothetical protein